jgi:hypothetical protein
MSKLLTRLQTLGQKAAQARIVIDSAPARAAQVREAVHATAGRLQELRAEVEGTLTDLKTDSDVSLAAKLSELDGAGPVFARAGFRLAGIDVEQGTVPRVLVHLDRAGGGSALPEQLISECGDRRTVLAILAALERAGNMADDVSPKSFGLRGVTVQLGAVPAVRLLWRPVGQPAESPVPVPPPLPGHPAKALDPTPTPAASGFQSYGSGSYFERRVPTAAEPVPVPRTEFPAHPAIPAPGPVPMIPAVQTGDWRKDALARFKKMPDLRR